MNVQKRIEMYLAKANEAEEQASLSEVPQVREAWKVISEAYRDLAQQNGYNSQNKRPESYRQTTDDGLSQS